MLRALALQAAGYEFAFMTTFVDEAGRDAYLDHAAHVEFAGKIFSHIERVLVMDFFETLVPPPGHAPCRDPRLGLFSAPTVTGS